MRTSQARLVACYVGATQLRDTSGPKAADTRTILTDTIRVLSDLVKEREAQPGQARGDSTGTFSLLLEDAACSSDPVADMAFIASSQLRRKFDELEAVTAGPVLLVEEACDSCLRHIIKATSTVEPVLAAAHGLVPRLTTDAQRDESLAVRRVYSDFRRQLGDAPSLDHARACIRELTSQPSFRHARTSDQAEVTALAERLRGAADGELDSGQVLSDLAAFAVMLRDVGRREELLAHDLRAIPEAIERVETLLEVERPILRGHLERVRGVDDEIESLLSPGQPIDGERLLAALRRALEERRRAAGWP